MLKSLKDSLTRNPFGFRDKAAAADHAPAHGAADEATKSLLLFGHEESAKRLSQLEALRETVRATRNSVRGVLIGMPFSRVERTLRSAGFNTEENLLSFNAPRVNLRFEHEASGSFWHISGSEFAKTSKNAADFVPGQSYPIEPELLFTDWEPIPGERMKSRHTGRELPRPKELIFRQVFKTSGIYGYDAVACGRSVDEIITRLKQLEPLGLNATNFVRALLVLLRATGRNLTSPTLHRMISDESERQLLLEYLAAAPTSKTTEENAEILAARDAVLEMHERVPPMAHALSRKLLETYLGRELVPREDLLVHGKLWHIDTSSDAGRYLAYCVKQDIQSQALEFPEGHDLTLIFAGEWDQFELLELDARCLARKDILQCFITGKPQRILERQGGALIDFIRAFPRHYWHLSSGEAEAEIFDRIYPYIAHARQHLAFLPWERRLEAVGGKIREVAVDLNVDGLEMLERAARSKIKRTIERGGFAVD